MSNRVLAGVALVVLIGGAVAFLHGAGFFDSTDPELYGAPGVEEDAERTDDETGVAARRESTDLGAAERADIAESPVEEEKAPADDRRSAVVKGRAVSGEATPLADVDARITAAGGRRLGASRTGADGAFAITVPAGAAGRLRLSASGIASLPVEVPSLREDQELDVGDLPVLATTSIHVSVTNTSGKALGGAGVKLMQNTAINEMNLDFVKLLRDIFKEDTAIAAGVAAKDGTFIFEEVPAGEYVVLGSAEGHQLRFSDSIKAAAGAAPPRVELSLSAGRVLSGRVVDEDDVGIEAAIVAVLPEPDGFPSVLKTIKQETDSEGHFEFTRLGAGEHVVLVRAKGYTAATNDDVNIDDGKPLLIKLSRGVTIAGRVYDQATGDGLAGADVMALGDNGTLIETTSDGEGEFELTGVGTGRRTSLLARLDGWSVVAPEGQRIGFGGGGGIDVDTKGATGRIAKDVPMTRGGVVEGRAFDTETGESLAGVTVRVMSPSAFGGGTGKRYEAVSGEDGRFRVERVPTGGVMAFGAKRGYVPDTEDDSMSRLFGNDDKAPKVIAGGSVTIDVPMKRGATLRGLVVDPDGAALAGATVRFFERDSGLGFVLMMAGGGSAMGEALTGKDGRFELVGVPKAEKVIVYAAHPEFVGGAQTVLDTRTPRSAELRLQVTVGALLMATVLEPDGRPAAGRTFKLVPETPTPGRNFWDESSIKATTDDRGRVRFPAVAPGKVTLSIRADDVVLPVPSQTHELADGQTKDVRVRLERVLMIKGRVLDQHGDPVGGASIHAGIPKTMRAAGEVDAGEEELRDAKWANTDASGEFTVGGVSSGAGYQIQVSKWGPNPAAGGEDSSEMAWIQIIDTVAVDGVQAGTENLVIRVVVQE